MEQQEILNRIVAATRELSRKAVSPLNPDYPKHLENELKDLLLTSPKQSLKSKS